MRTRLVLGGPGTGKTTRLLSIVEEEMEAGTRGDRLALATFTKRAAEEAVSRACARFRLRPRDLPLFRTLHSLCYRARGGRRTMMERSDYVLIARELGLGYTGAALDPDGGRSPLEGDHVQRVSDLARVTLRTAEETWVAEGSPFPIGRVVQWDATVREYKESRGRVDFTDLLEEFLAAGSPVGARVALIDEAQDLTPLQWEVARLAFRDVERLYVAGDDDQAIFGWMGADVDGFLRLPHDEREVLPVSYRLPRDVFGFATRFAGRNIRERYPKEWRPREENGSGFVRTAASLADLDLLDGSSWFVLARNACFLRDGAPSPEDLVRELGVHYLMHGAPGVRPEEAEAIAAYERWRASSDPEDLAEARRCAEPSTFRALAALPEGSRPPWDRALDRIRPDRAAYYRKLLRVDGTLEGPARPKIALGTIHGAKGGEADHVAVLPEQTRRTRNASTRDRAAEDAEARVFYVAVTRARQGVHLLCPRGGIYYPEIFASVLREDVA